MAHIILIIINILTGKKYYHVDILDKLLEIPEEKEKIIQQILKLIVEMP